MPRLAASTRRSRLIRPNAVTSTYVRSPAADTPCGPDPRSRAAGPRAPGQLVDEPVRAGTPELPDEHDLRRVERRPAPVQDHGGDVRTADDDLVLLGPVLRGHVHPDVQAPAHAEPEHHPRAEQDVARGPLPLVPALEGPFAPQEQWDLPLPGLPGGAPADPAECGLHRPRQVGRRGHAELRGVVQQVAVPRRVRRRAEHHPAAVVPHPPLDVRGERGHGPDVARHPEDDLVGQVQAALLPLDLVLVAAVAAVAVLGDEHREPPSVPAAAQLGECVRAPRRDLAGPGRGPGEEDRGVPVIRRLLRRVDDGDVSFHLALPLSHRVGGTSTGKG
jgi:hypothetical protein